MIESLSVVPASVIAFSVEASAASESAGQAQVAVVRSGPENRTATVDYSSSNGAASGTLTFDPGQTTKVISVPVAGDTRDEADEKVTLTLSNAGANALVGGQGTTTLTIVDDDDKRAAAKPKRVGSSLRLGAPGSRPGDGPPRRGRQGPRHDRALALGPAGARAGAGRG